MPAPQPLSRLLRQGHWRSATAALALVGLTVGAVSVAMLRSEVGRSLAGVARSAAFNADVAVIFEDAQAAAELLRLLVAQERLASIEIVLTDGRVLAREQRPAGWLGGDEFAILLAPLADAADADRVARKIEAQMHQPLQLDGLTPPVPPIVPRVSIGLAMYPADGADAQALLQHADRLMYERKRGQREAPAA